MKFLKATTSSTNSLKSKKSLTHNHTKTSEWERKKKKCRKISFVKPAENAYVCVCVCAAAKVFTHTQLFIINWMRAKSLHTNATSIKGIVCWLGTAFMGTKKNLFIFFFFNFSLFHAAAQRAIHSAKKIILFRHSHSLTHSIRSSFCSHDALKNKM